ncbi:MAG TPA: ComEC/Rec2 family competence protein, partial [Bacilli bacterium]|nr:ComEC/Rec2 family competence protein [Bacilli bacterium]
MKVLRHILQYKFIYIILVILALIYSFIFNNLNIKSKYSLEDTYIEGYINYYYIDGNKLTIELIGKEKVLCVYYLKEESELNFSDNYFLGDTVKLYGELSIPSTNVIFNLFNYKEYLKYEGINYIFNIESIEKIKNNNKLRYKIKNKIISIIDKNINKEYLYTFILGNSKYINSDVMDSYRVNGISHLFAVSGMHVSLISLIALKLLKKFKYKYLLVAMLIIFYMFLTDYSPSILRAGFLFILLILNKKLASSFINNQS